MLLSSLLQKCVGGRFWCLMEDIGSRLGNQQLPRASAQPVVASCKPTTCGRALAGYDRPGGGTDVWLQGTVVGASNQCVRYRFPIVIEIQICMSFYITALFSSLYLPKTSSIGCS
jgi:hypothetical protein